MNHKLYTFVGIKGVSSFEYDRNLSKFISFISFQWNEISDKYDKRVCFVNFFIVLREHSVFVSGKERVDDEDSAATRRVPSSGPPSDPVRPFDFDLILYP